jgi:uncharacterized protein (DUF697 family)
VGANPIPFADVAGGVAVDAAMVIALAKMYGFDLTRKNALNLVGSIVHSAGAVTIVEYATHLVANAINLSTFFVGAVATAIPQAVMAAFGSYVVGHAGQEYFKHGSWGEGGPKAVVERILQQMDKQSVMSMLKEQIERELQVNAHANRNASA